MSNIRLMPTQIASEDRPYQVEVRYYQPRRATRNCNRWTDVLFIYHTTSHGVSKSLRIHSIEFKLPATVSFNTGSTAEIWRRWQQQFQIYFEAAELATQPPKTQVAILLHCAGREAQDIFTHLVFVNTVDDKDTNWEHVLKKFKTYCEPRKNEVFERYKFWQRDQRQAQGENIDQWVNDLRILLSTCEYGQQKESSLRDRIVFVVADIRLKERLLRESDWTLEKALDVAVSTYF